MDRYYDVKHISKCIPGLTILEELELRWSVFTGCINEQCDFVAKIILNSNDDREYKIYQILKNDDITPRFIDYKYCELNDKGVYILVTEKYNNTLLNLLNHDLSEGQVRNIFMDILEKSIKLNFVYQIRHGDFHAENILYKIDSDGIKLGFIDFEFSTVYNNNIPILGQEEYNPYHDILQLEYSYIPKYRLKFNVPETYRDMYMNSLNEADLEIINENIEQKMDAPILEFNIKMLK